MVDVTSTAAITATVTAYKRIEKTLATIQKLLDCRPAPDEIIVHVDAGQTNCADAVSRAYPSLVVIISNESIGPGGGRNKLMAAARNPIVANFDDDSYPYDPDFFGRAVALFERFPEVSLIGAEVFHPGQPIPSDRRSIRESSSFSGGGVVFRADDLLDVGGYLPLPIAYGAEEEEIAFRLLEHGRAICFSPWLRVFHDSSLEHHATAEINAQVIANLGLVAFLRYPRRYWPYGALQVGNRLLWSVRAGRFRGVLAGIALLPTEIFRHRHHRRPVSVDAFHRKFAARRAESVDF
jgi:GT2 family glycosyltransferase